MKRVLALLGISVLFCGIAFAGNQNEPKSDPDLSELERHAGKIHKIDIKEKTITLRLAPPVSTTTQEVSSSTQTQTSTAEEKLKVLRFNERTELVALETEETPMTTRISDLDADDKIVVYVDSEGLIHRIEMAADED
jgi:hypothetical protein